MSNITKYQPFSLEALEEANKEVADVSSGVIMPLAEGTNIVRFMPVPLGSKMPVRVTAVHFVDPLPGSDNKFSFACPRRELRQQCPACQESEKLIASRNPADRELGKSLRSKLRIYANVVDRSSSDNSVRVISFGKKIWDQLEKIRKNPRLGGDWTNPTEEGFDIIIERTGTGQYDTEYTVSADRKNSPLAETQQEIDMLVESCHDLEQFIQPEVPEELLQAWGALASVGRGKEMEIVVESKPVAILGADVMPPKASNRKAQSAVKKLKYDDDFNSVEAEEDDIPY